MKKLITTIAITILLASGTCSAINPLDSIAPNDKQLHFMGNYIVTDVMQDRWKMTPLTSLFWVNALSHAKESIDVACGGEYDYTDISANLAGWLAYNTIHLDLYKGVKIKGTNIKISWKF